MNKAGDTFIILSPAFAAFEGDSWLPAQEGFVLALNRHFPNLNVLVLSFHFPVRPERRYRWFGNEVITFNGGMKGGKLGSLLRWKRVWQALSELRRARTIVGIFSFFCSECAFVGHYFARRAGLKHFIWVLGQDARAENRQVKRIRPASDELVCISDFLVREFHRNHGIRPAHMIPTGVDVSLYQEGPGSRNIDLLGAGSLIPLKQFDMFIDVVKTISSAVPGIQAAIAGAGPEEERLKAAIRDGGMEARLLMKGRLPHAEVLQLMQGSKILLHTSSYEGLSGVCLEALYAGAHVISFCRAMDKDIPHWHIVQSPEEMASVAIALLQSERDHSPVLPYETGAMAKELMALYGIRPESAS